MAISIIDSGNYILFDDGSVQASLNKPFEFEILTTDNRIKFYNLTNRQGFTYNYSDITSPTSSDVNDLADIVMAYNNTIQSDVLLDEVNKKSIVDTNNSTSTLLNSGATFTGTATDVSEYPSIVFSCKTDQDGLLYAEFSTDGTNWDSSLEFEIYANINEVHRLTVSKKYFRLRINNTSASNQTYLRAQVLLGNSTTLNSPLNSTIFDDHDTIIVRPVDFNLMVADGRFRDRQPTIKDGINFDIDSGTVPEDLWEGGGTYTGFVSSADAAEIVVAGADTGTVYYSYMATDTSLDYTFGTKVITGAGTYSLGHNIWRCNFAYFQSSSATNVGNITIRHTATPTNIFCVILANYGQTYCGAYTVPYRSSIYIDRITATVRGSTSASLDGFFWYKPFGGSPYLRFPFEAQYGGLFFDDPDYLIKIPERVDFIPRIITSSGNNIQVKVSYRLLKIK